MNDWGSNGKSEAGTAPAPNETAAAIKPAAIADALKITEDLTPFGRIQRNYHLSRKQIKARNPISKRLAAQSWIELLEFPVLALGQPGSPRIRLAAASAGAWMKAAGRIVRLGRTGEHGGKRLNGRCGVMDFGWDANRGSDERRKAVVLDAGLGHLGFGARIDQDRAFIAKIERTPSTVATILLIAAAAIAFLIWPLLLRLFRGGWIVPVLVIRVLKRTLRPRETLSVFTVMEKSLPTGLRGAWLGLRDEAWLRRRRPGWWQTFLPTYSDIIPPTAGFIPTRLPFRAPD